MLLELLLLLLLEDVRIPRDVKVAGYGAECGERWTCRLLLLLWVTTMFVMLTTRLMMMVLLLLLLFELLQL